MKLLNLIFLGLLSSSLATAYPTHYIPTPVYSIPAYEPAPIYYTPAPAFYPPVNIYTPPVIAKPYYTDYYCPYCYDYQCYGCNEKAGAALALWGIGLYLVVMGAVVYNS